VTWEIVLSMATYPFNGTITQVNGGQVTGTSGTDVTIKGASYNKTLAAGASVTFTYQADRGSAPPPVGVATATITVNSEWGTGYCADVTVSTTSPVPITWQVTKTRITDAPFLANPALWPASLTSSNLTTVSLTGVAWVFKGPSWANTIVAGQTQTIGYCANKS
jgi:cellulase/cellobiase CelA1